MIAHELGGIQNIVTAFMQSVETNHFWGHGSSHAALRREVVVCKFIR